MQRQAEDNIFLSMIKPYTKTVIHFAQYPKKETSDVKTRYVFVPRFNTEYMMINEIQMIWR